jgi:hypothetical protein
MDGDGFWALVDRTRAEAERQGGDSVVAEHVRTLSTALEQLPVAELRDFDRRQREARSRANTWELWAAAYLALGGCSDDGFLDFRTWLITHGRVTFERVLADPDSLADLSWDEEENDFGAAEHWAYVSTELLEEEGIDEDDDEEFDDYAEPTGEPFPEDDDAWFASRFPRLWARHGAAEE